MGWTRLDGLEVASAAQERGGRLVLHAEAGAAGLPLMAMGDGAAAGRPVHTGGLNVLLGDGSVRSSAAPRHFDGVVSRFSAGRRDARLGAELDLTRLDRQGREVPVMRVFINGITIVGREPAAAKGGNDVAMEKIVIAHEGMNHSGGSPSMDLTQQVAALFETYDYPGSYAQRFDGVDTGGTSKERITSWDKVQELRSGR